MSLWLGVKRDFERQKVGGARTTARALYRVVLEGETLGAGGSLGSEGNDAGQKKKTSGPPKAENHPVVVKGTVGGQKEI